jgi:branched-chain amino acid transport system permease protein
MRRTRIARVLIATRENEANVRAFGLGVVQAKLMAFAISGGLAGFAGAIFALQQRGLSRESFTAQAGLDVFVMAVFGGISAVSGALIGSGWFQVTRYFSAWPIFLLITGPFATLAVLFAAPGGLISLVMRVRDGILKIIAQRRQIIVPSLFADMDPDDLEARLWPLAEPLSSSGLAALPNAPRMSLESGLYGEDPSGITLAVLETASASANGSTKVTS